MAFQEWVTIRDEVAKKEIYGIVRLYRLEEKGTLESDPERFLDITFPTSTLRQLLTSVIRKLVGKEQRGTFAVTGGGGSGKSHILVATTHLLRRGPEALKWFETNDIEGADQLPQDTLVLAYQLVAEGGPIVKLWMPLLEALGRQDLVPSVERWPTVKQIRAALGDRPIVILLDEWEDWYSALTTQQKQWNRNFIQNLSEVGDQKGSRLVLIVSSLERETSIRFVLTRADIAIYDLDQDVDKEDIVLHRLFASRRPDGDAICAYMNVYANNQEIFGGTTGALQKYRDTVVSRYPIHPELLRLAFEAYGRHRHYQHTRGVLAFLADVVMEHKDDRDLLLPCDVNPYSRETQYDLNRLDSALLGKFMEDAERAKGISRSLEILTPVFLWSLTEARGIEEARALLGAVRPNVTIAELQTALAQCYDKCWHLRKRDGNYIFEPRRKIRVVVDERARRNLQDPKMKKEAKTRFAELIKGEVLLKVARVATYQVGTEDIEEVFVYPVDSVPDTSKVKVVISLLNLADGEILDMLKTVEKANTVAVILPTTGQDLTSEGDFLLRSRRLVECELLKKEIEKEEQQELGDVEKEEREELIKTLRAAYGRYMKPLPPKAETHMALPIELGKEAILGLLKREHSPLDIKQACKQEVKAQAVKGMEVGILLGSFLKYRHLPMLLSRATFEEKVKELALEGEIVIEDGVTVLDSESPEAIKRLALGDKMRLKDAKFRGVASPEEKEEVPVGPGPITGGSGIVIKEPPPTPLTPVRTESRPFQAATPPGLRAEVYNKLEEKAKVIQFSIDITAESLDGIEKLNELLQELKAKGIRGQIGFNFFAHGLSLSKANIIDLINKLPMPVSETQLPADTITLNLEVEIEEH
ncbi:hypothetical protein M1O47_01715 [Dehalococcoidia bacterium]|nr:hypothetical protein [Dehalococcoidia bacterium]